MATETRNSKVLASFVAYCQAHPNERFWQALLNWSGLNYIVHMTAAPMFVNCKLDNGTIVPIKDTYYWEGQNG